MPRREDLMYSRTTKLTVASLAQEKTEARHRTSSHEFVATYAARRRNRATKFMGIMLTEHCMAMDEPDGEDDNDERRRTTKHQRRTTKDRL